MQSDILAFGAHPDDVELGAGGTILRHTMEGKTVAIVDLTRGELGTRGTADIRHDEAQAAAKILGATARQNLDLGDGFFTEERASQLRIIEMVRKFRPQVVLANAVSDRHPDHGRAARLVETASFLAGLVKIETELDGVIQEPWRPKVVYHYAQGHFHQPSFVVDISAHFEKKMEAVKAYKSQFHDPKSREPSTLISEPWFINQLEARAIEYGRQIGVQYGEGFVASRDVGIRSFFDLI